MSLTLINGTEGDRKVASTQVLLDGEYLYFTHYEGILSKVRYDGTEASFLKMSGRVSYIINICILTAAT